MNCIQCTNVINRSAVMARNGYAGCKLRPEGKFRDLKKEHACPDFVSAPEDVMRRRGEWAGKAA